LKIEIQLAVVKGRNIVIDVKTTRGYTNEINLLLEMMSEENRATYFVGDRYYIKRRLIKKVCELEMVSLIKTKDGIHNKASIDYKQ